ncbi:MAG TPA: hypothetical protein VK021_09910 [Flavobacteriaceae bacterium]|nr:hypothetical protein [Flavobacteriaceae bacterium]
MAKILFHCGAHKTASKHLQYNLKLNEKYLASKGIKYIDLQNYKGLSSKMIHLRRKYKKEDYDIVKASDEIRQIINEGIKGYDKAIISYEGPFGDMNHHKLKTIYPNAEELIIIYKDILKDHEVTPVYVTRNYNDFINSAYKWQLKYGYTNIKLSESAENLDFQTPRWSAIINALNQTFTNPIVWSFEDYKTNADNIFCALINQISDETIPCEKLQFYEGKRNAASKKNIVKFHYIVNQIFRGKIRRRRINIKTNRHFGQTANFICALLPNPVDISLKERFDSMPIYEKEMESIKNNPDYITLPYFN